jgi:hypothetical protein
MNSFGHRLAPIFADQEKSKEKSALIRGNPWRVYEARPANGSRAMLRACLMAKDRRR